MLKLNQLTNEAYEINCYITYYLDKHEQCFIEDLTKYMRMFENYTYYYILLGAENYVQEMLTECDDFTRGNYTCKIQTIHNAYLRARHYCKLLNEAFHYRGPPYPNLIKAYKVLL